jgi:hypothetical protein
VDQYTHNRQKETFWNLLANPANTGPLYTESLQQLVNDHPQSGILQVLLARTGGTAQLSKAAVYYNARALYKLVNNPQELAKVPQERIISGRDDKPARPENYFSIGTIETDTYTEFNDIPQTSNHTVPSTESTPASRPVSVYDPYDIPLPGHNDAALSSLAEEGIQDTDTITNSRPEKEYFRQDIDDEVYDEIVSIDNFTISNEDEVYDEIVSIEDITIANEKNSGPAPAPENTDINAAEERLILGNIVSADYLLFDKKLDALRNAPAESVTPQEAEPLAEKQEVSRYDDDKLPYSFLWWLDKTRKEHAGNFQPYAPKAPENEGKAPEKAIEADTDQPAKRNAADELQQQYFENIFSLTSVNAIEKSAEAQPVEFDHTKKEDVIIERFIHTEPQIKPQPADRLDNENKAKKSSEDQDELVTETLARIYTDQMLYHKAVATYKKLILKFPEKKLYFASRIEELEKKIN